MLPTGKIGTDDGSSPEKAVVNYRYRKLPVEVEAFQMTFDRRNNRIDWPKWLCEAAAKHRLLENDDLTFDIQTLEGRHHVRWGDWIVRGVAGELYPVKPAIFEKTYVEVNEGRLMKAIDA